MSETVADVERSLSRLRAKVSGLQDDMHSVPKKWGTTGQRIRWVIQTIINAVMDLLVGLVLFVLDLFMWSWEIGFLLMFALTLITIRGVFLALCPIMILHYKFATGIINAILVFMEIGVDVAITALDAIFVVVNTIITIINGISKLTGHGKVTSFQFHLVHWVKINTLSYAQVKEVLSTLPPTCARYDTSGSVLQYYLQTALNKYTCPVVRFVFADPVVYQIAYTILGFTIRGSPRPDLFTPDDNCSEGNDTNEYDAACAGMGTPFVMLDVFLTIVILYLFLRNLWHSAQQFMSLMLFFVAEGIQDVYDVIMQTLLILFF